jgi:hypothetical protein
MGLEGGRRRCNIEGAEKRTLVVALSVREGVDKVGLFISIAAMMETAESQLARSR